MSKTGKWEPVPEDEKEAVLRAQQVEKWLDELYALYRHFNKDRIEALEDFSIDNRDLVREDFDYRLTVTLRKRRHSKRASPTSLSAYAEVCGVHKSTISRYLKAHGFVINGKPISQNQELRLKRIEATVALFNACRDNDGDFSKLGPVIGLLQGQKDGESGYALGLGFWMEKQTEEVQDRVYRDLGQDPVEERNRFQSMIKAFGMEEV